MLGRQAVPGVCAPGSLRPTTWEPGSNAIAVNSSDANIFCDVMRCDAMRCDGRHGVPVLMMEPPPLRSSAGTAYLQPRNTPLTLTFIVKSHTSSVVLTASSSSACEMPALLNTTLRLPSCASPNDAHAQRTRRQVAAIAAPRTFSPSSIIRWQSVALVTSATRALATPPLARMRLTCGAERVSERARAASTSRSNASAYRLVGGLLVDVDHENLGALASEYDARRTTDSAAGAVADTRRQRGARGRGGASAGASTYPVTTAARSCKRPAFDANIRA